MQLGPRGAGAQPRNQLEPYVAIAVHALRVYLQDVAPPLEVRQTELHLAVQPPGPQERRIERVRPVRRHQDLDVPPRVEAVELGDDLEHRALDLVVATVVVAPGPRSPDGVDLVEEDYASALRACHGEELAHHPRPLADVLLHELGADDADEARVGAVGHRSGGEGFALTRAAGERERAEERCGERWIGGRRRGVGHENETIEKRKRDGKGIAHRSQEDRIAGRPWEARSPTPRIAPDEGGASRAPP